MLNKAIIQGRLTKDPEIRTTQSGTPVASFTVAWSESNDRKLFLNCVAWKATAEMLKKHFSKGKEIVVEGTLGSRSWEDRDGNKREVVELTADRIHFCGPKDKVEAPKGYEQVDDDDDLPWEV